MIVSGPETYICTFDIENYDFGGFHIQGIVPGCVDPTNSGFVTIKNMTTNVVFSHF